MKNKIFLLLITLLLVSPMLSALLDENTQVNPNTNAGYIIDYPKFPSVKVNQPFNLSIEVYNISDGLEVTTATCSLAIQNQTGQYQSFSLPYVDNKYNVFIDSGNFTQGIFSFDFYCNTSILGGFASGLFQVTQTGDVQTTSQSIGSSVFLGIMIFLTLIFGYLGFRFIESEYLWVLGSFFVFLSCLMIFYVTWLGVEYYTLYVGVVNNSIIPQLIFGFFGLVLAIGLIAAGLLLFKKIPSWVKKIFPFLKKEDGWDENVFDKE